MSQFFGKYRGTVSNNVDPMMLGRVQVSVPAVYGDNSLNWAMPCTPYAGPGVGLFLVPPNGANVWVEFEGGDPDYPIWAGCFWGVGEVPAQPALAAVKLLKTDFAKIQVTDTPLPAEVSIEMTNGMKVKLSLTGIEIDNGMGASIKLQGPNVSVNNGALDVT